MIDQRLKDQIKELDYDKKRLTEGMSEYNVVSYPVFARPLDRDSAGKSGYITNYDEKTCPKEATPGYAVYDDFNKGISWFEKKHFEAELIENDSLVKALKETIESLKKEIEAAKK